ncbi:hypothetical protein BC829DRAFT_395106, partial [Chytridium lagenaria]
MILANTVSNWKDLEKSKYEDKNVVTKLSFDDGARWTLLRPPPKDADGKEWHCRRRRRVVSSDCALHLHSVTTAQNIGRVFSSNAAPGLIIGVGETWVNTAKGPHNVIILVPDNGPTDYILYSTNVENRVLTRKSSQVQTKKCGSGDFEEWSPTMDGKAECIMGEKLTFKRRKADANCSVGRKFKEADVVAETCECAEVDYECDFGFKPKSSEADSRLECEMDGSLLDQPEQCKKGEKYMGTSGYKKIPGNKCKNGKDLDKKQERE